VKEAPDVPDLLQAVSSDARIYADFPFLIRYTSSNYRFAGLAEIIRARVV
jgi:hypothetical protein